MKNLLLWRVVGGGMILWQSLSAVLCGQTEIQSFDDAASSQSAGWMANDEGQNPNRDCAGCETDLGWKPTNNAGAAAGEGGGKLHRAGGLPVGFYGDISIGELTLDMSIKASGKLALINTDFDGEAHLGFFNGARLLEDATDLGADMGFIIAEPGGGVEPNFRWGPIVRTDGGLGDRNNISFQNGLPNSKPIDFSIEYNPDGGSGFGLLTLNFEGEPTVERELTQAERADGATFTTFGMHTGSLIGTADQRSFQLLIDDVAYTSLLSDITPGDFNSDGAVDAVDFNILVGNFNTDGKAFADGDIDFNARIDLSDFVIFRQVFQDANPAVAAVPEPGSCVSAIWGFLALGRVCRRRRSR